MRYLVPRNNQHAPTNDLYTHDNVLGAVATGTDTYAATYAPAPTSYQTGLKVLIKFANANTGAATLNLNSLGAKSIKKNVSEALVSGDIKNGEMLLLAYDGTNFQVVTKVNSEGIATALGPQAANTVYAGPSSGASSNPAFRAIVKDDIGFLSKFYYVGASNGSDDKTAIDAAVALAKANGGGAVIFNPGDYYTTATLEYTDLRDVKFIGNGTTINSNFLTGDVLYIHPTTAPTAGQQDVGIQGLVIDGFVFESSVKKTSGAAIHVQYSEFARITNIRIDKIRPSTTSGQSNFYDGIYMEYQGGCYIATVQITCSHYGLKVSGANDTSGAGGTYFNYDGTLTGNFEIWGDRTAGSIGVLVGGGTGGFQFGQGNLVLFETGVKVDQTLSAFVNRELFFDKAFIDSMDGHGIDIANSSLQRLHATGLWIAGMGRGASHIAGGSLGCGINVGTGLTRAACSGLYIYSTQGSGIQAASGEWVINGSTISDAGLGTNGGDGITMTGTAMADIVINGNLIKTIGSYLKGACVRLANSILSFNVSGNTLAGYGQIGYYGPPHDDANSKIVYNNAGHYSAVSYFSDTFNASNITNINGRTPSSATPFKWSKDPSSATTSDVGIVSNAAKSATAVTGQYWIETNIRNIDIRWTIGTVPSSGSILGVFAFVDSVNKFHVNLMNGQVDQVLASVSSTPVAASGTSVAGDIIRVNLNGTTVTVYRNGVQIGTGTVSASVNGTKHGMLFFGTSTGTINEVTTQAAS